MKYGVWGFIIGVITLVLPFILVNFILMSIFKISVNVYFLVGFIFLFSLMSIGFGIISLIKKENYKRFAIPGIILSILHITYWILLYISLTQGIVG